MDYFFLLEVYQKGRLVKAIPLCFGTQAYALDEAYKIMKKFKDESITFRIERSPITSNEKNNKEG